ncbi:DUF6885 family protein [Amycolatopsis regifaucium]|uniref:Uncharacterized protein n=1 Tax=Amycolatopsis regifaucium TaxID=546365 RepID=A0A154MR47_9PSEU|nr:hypothetical protein [Amycolatopsis regifaucium]KZB86752.1 hypothetical protein AVL48_25550 [Amycolatopsis regifaucium]OKA10839.1 hypothetical protein ATP06_0201410 [Amycolatopsis regifaucium]SFI19618.1 hypothetical protein SAMN04489731_10927 [Amycolatopsis regifaucium]
MSSGIDGDRTGLSGRRWLPGGEHLVTVARAELPQKEGLAAPFVALTTLRAAGFDVPGQDEVAAVAGTTPEGLPRAIEALSGGRLAAVPATGHWAPQSLFMLLAGLWRLPRVAVIAEVDPAEFGAHDTPVRALLDYLDTGIPPLWSSRFRPAGGHTVLVAGLRIGAEGTLLSIMDGHPSLGDNGLHDQPVDWVAAALSRMLIVVDDGDTEAAVAAITTAGLWS